MNVLPPPLRVVLVGTGTDVGKTHVTSSLLALARSRGVRAVGYKPIATGVEGLCGDAELHAAASGLAYEHPTYCYTRPVSPHLAAREEGRPIDLDPVVRRVEALAGGAPAILVESAGGLFSPVSDTATNIELVKRLAPILVVLVAPDRLGVLHDVTACTIAARASGVTLHALVLSAPHEPDASTGQNADELDRLGQGPVVSVFPRAAADDPRTLEAARRLWSALVALATTALFVLAGCSSSSASNAKTEAGVVGPVDGGVATHADAASESGHEAGQEAGREAGREAGQDAGREAGQEAGHDAGHEDAPHSEASASTDASTATPDPNAPGPYTYGEVDDTINVTASGDMSVGIHCNYPTSGPTKGPYPVVVVAHGLSLPVSQYANYVERLASFGYVALTVDYPASVFSVNNPGEAEDLLAGLDWTGTNATVAPFADPKNAGMTGHSLGGKVALLAATMDPRVKAAIVLDPVDSGGGQACTAPDCVTVATLLPALQIPTGFLGETTDGTGGVGGMPCAPTADNFMSFYAQANSPSLEVTVTGAEHMSFLDDVSTCGLICSFCTPGTASNAVVNGLAQAYVAAFYERWIRGNGAYDAYLTGALADARYVATGEATITSK